MSVEEFNSPEFRELYKKTPIAFPYLVFPKILKMLGEIENKTILDLGCGWGNFSATLAKKGANVVGIDISQEWIDECKKLHGEKNNLKFYVADATNLKKLNSEQFDIVIMNMVFIEMDSKEKVKKVFDEVYRVLKNKGIFIFTDIHPIDKSTFKTTTRFHIFPSDFSYFNDGSKFKSKVLLEDGTFIEFTDFNWTIETYTELIYKTGFSIYRIVEPKPECKPDKRLEKYPFPEYLLFYLKKL